VALSKLISLSEGCHLELFLAHVLMIATERPIKTNRLKARIKSRRLIGPNGGTKQPLVLIEVVSGVRSISSLTGGCDNSP